MPKRITGERGSLTWYVWRDHRKLHGAPKALTSWQGVVADKPLVHHP